MQKLPKNPQKSSRQKSAKKPTKIFYDFFNKKLIKNIKNIKKLFNFTKHFKTNTNNMKKFEFICKNSMITGETVYLTREDGVYVSNSLRFNKDEAYDIFIKLTNQEPLEVFEVLETKTSPTE